ncbi:MAG: RtcB family protein [Saprospiraceae bacterium]|nr:RtcB family protein [Saprospiraceae bacterium]MCB9321246.1 RtcB family protein [Lewinellaceae bacterium]
MPNKSHLHIFGEPLIDEATIRQINTCARSGSYAALTADAHYGYSHPIGGVVAYRDQVSLSGVGFDIACGNKAVRTMVDVADIDIVKLMDEIERVISFGIGRKNQERVDHPVLDRIARLDLGIPASQKNSLREKAVTQLGTVGAGNHFVDLFTDDAGKLWIGVHFGSRGFGHSLTMGFIALAQGKAFGDRVQEGSMDAPPILFHQDSPTGQAYLEALDIAGEYAYAGRDWVVNRILQILQTHTNYEVHNHHNFAWKETHFEEAYWVVRKGCTPAFPGQQGFIGSTMLDESVIVEGVESPEARDSLYSTVHGAGRVMSRRQAAGKIKWQKNPDGTRRLVQVAPGKVDFRRTQSAARSAGVELRGGGADESPECYKSLQEVLSYHAKTIRILYRLRPVGVIMAGAEVYDPYKD